MAHRYLYVMTCSDCPAYDDEWKSCRMHAPGEDGIDLARIISTMDPPPKTCPLRTQPVRIALHVGARLPEESK